MLDQNPIAVVFGMLTGGGVRAKQSAERKIRLGDFSVEGTLERGLRCRFSVAGEDFDISDNTWVVGRLEFGAKVKVKGRSDRLGQKQATRVLILE